MTISEPQLLPRPEHPHRFTRDEYYQMGDLGFFNDRRVELIEGEIIDMSPQRDTHAVAIGMANYVLQAAFPGTWVRVQLPMTLNERSEPEPDLSVVPGVPKEYLGTGKHPKTALLVVEISESSLLSDRKVKAALYARAGLPEFWIVNLVNRQVEVHREPREGRYESVVVIKPGESIHPLGRPEAAVQVADLLP